MTATGNERNGAEAMVRMLADHGVRHIFGLCGDTSLPFYDALARMDHGMVHMLCRDERHAAYMADAYARVAGRVGVCEGPSGGGATYILPGVVEANESGVPVLAITSDVSTRSKGRFPLTELDQEALFRPLTKWNAVLGEGAALPRAVRRAFREMTTGRTGAAHLCLPFDVQQAPVPEAEIWADPRFGAFPASRAAPEPGDVARALAVLAEAERPLIVCGGGVLLSGAEDALRGFAERLGIPVATTVSGQGGLAETHPLCVGVVGSNGGRPETRAVVDAADCIVFVGCRAGSVTTERWRAPGPGRRIVHIDVDPAAIGANYRTDAAVCADAKLALAAARDATEGPARAGADAVAARVWDAKRAHFAPLAESLETPIRPERVVAALDRLLPDDALLCADAGTPCPYVSAYFTVRKPGRRIVTNRAHGALGFALAAAIGAQIARPDAPVAALMGDGSFAMCAGELETAARYGLPITLVVCSNGVYGWIKAGQKAGFGERYFGVDFSPTDHAAVAAAYGVKARRVEDPRDLETALRDAIRHDGPALVDVVVQPLQDAAAPVSEWVA